MKYKLINNKTKEEHLCDKVTTDGFDYYVSDDHPSTFEWKDYTICLLSGELDKRISCCDFCKKVIATNNPDIDISKVVDEAEKLAKELVHSEGIEVKIVRSVWIHGYNKSQETHPFSEKDMIEFAEWIADSKLHGYSKQLYEAMIRYKVSTTKELLQIWKEQRPKIVYYD